MTGAGPMVERVALDRPAAATDAYGASVDGWTEVVGRCSAHIRWLRGGESVQAARLEGRQPAVVTIYRQDALAALGPGWRLRDLNRGGAAMNIRAVVPTDDRMFLELTGDFGVSV